MGPLGVLGCASGVFSFFKENLRGLPARRILFSVLFVFSRLIFAFRKVWTPLGSPREPLGALGPFSNLTSHTMCARQIAQGAHCVPRHVSCSNIPLSNNPWRPLVPSALKRWTKACSSSHSEHGNAREYNSCRQHVVLGLYISGSRRSSHKNCIWCSRNRCTADA